MSNTFKIFIAVFLAIIAANFFNSAMFRLWYPSDTQLAVQQSQKYIDEYNKINAERVASTLKHHEQVRNTYIEKTMDQKFRTSYQNDKTYFDNSNKYAEQLKQREREKIERQAAMKERERLQDIENETRRKRQKNKLADLEHIRSENMKTCKFWTEEHKRNPAPQNERHKKTSCDRAYNR